MKQYMKGLSAVLLAGAICVLGGTGCSAEQDTPAVSATVLISNTAEPSQEPAETTALTEEVPVEPESAFPVTVTGFDGMEITVSSANRIVSLSPATTSVLIQEGALPRIIGVDDASRGTGEDVQKLGSEQNPDTGAIIAMEPDIVFSSRGTPSEAVDAMRQAGIPVICAEAATFGEVPDSFLLVGQITGLESAGAALVSQLQTTMEDVAAASPATKPSCYYVISFGSDGNWTSGPGSIMNSLIEAAGGSCVTVTGPAPQYEYPVEELVEANPDCIIYASSAGSYSSLVEAPGYRDLAAVKNGKVFAINASTVTVPGTNLNEALLSVSSIIREAAQGPAPEEQPAGDETAVD